MIARAACPFHLAAGAALLATAMPARAQTDAGPAFPVTGKLCNYNKDNNRKALIEALTLAGESPAQQQARLADMDSAIAMAAIQAKCVVLVDASLHDLPPENRTHDLLDDVERAMKRVDVRDPAMPAATGICTVSVEEAKAALPPEGSPGLEAARTAAAQATEEQRCGIVFDTAQLLLPADSLDVTGKVMARMMGVQPGCTPGDIASGYWRGRHCLAMGGSWTARLNNDERKLVFRGVAGQRVRLTARRVDAGKDSFCRPTIRLRGPYWKSELAPAAMSPGPDIKSNWFEYVLPDTTDYAANLYCIYEMRGAGTEELSVSLEPAKG